MSSQAGAGTSVPSNNQLNKNGTKVPTPEGYKQTKVGVIPEEWEVVKLGDVIDFLDHKRKPIKSNDRQKIQGKYPYYCASGIIDYVNDYLFEGELILLGEDGANIIDRSSRLVFLANGKYWVNNHAHVLKSKSTMNNYFLCEYLESLNYEKYNTGTAQPKLNKDIVSKILVRKAPLKEQQKIAQILSTWDDAIGKQEQLIVAKETLKKGLMQRLLSGEVRFKQFGAGTSVPSSNISKNGTKVPAPEWGEVRLGDIVEINPRNRKLPNQFVYIDLESVKNGILLKETILNQNEAPSRAQRLLKKDDILFQMVRPYQKNNFYFELDGDYVASTGYAQIRTMECSKFIYHSMHLDTFVNKVLIRCTGTGYPAINSKDLAKIKIKLPPKKEQQKIAQVLTTADKEIELLKNELETLKEQKRGLMQRLLSGVVRVKV